MTLTLIRHARTVGHETGTLLGGSDPDAGLTQNVVPLTDAGCYEVVYCSPLRRARLTAAGLVPGRRVVLHDGLRERRLGDWEGACRACMRAAHPDSFLGSGTVAPTFTPPGGEPMEAVVERVTSFLRLIGADGRPSLVVTHHGVIRVALAITMGRPLAELLARSVPHLGRVEIDLNVNPC